MICNLCQRVVLELTVHHLIPQSESKRHKCKLAELPTSNLCHQCHKKIHSLFTNRQLGDKLNTIESLLEKEEIQKYLVWVKKIPGTQIYKEKR